ncbi:MAG: hypothetical protein KKF33_19505, partial [Alphaproteobacteria bacterium]|nr:hypothetical protein [Alphaproteobacteria bacterium]
MPAKEQQPQADSEVEIVGAEHVLARQGRAPADQRHAILKLISQPVCGVRLPSAFVISGVGAPGDR